MLNEQFVTVMNLQLPNSAQASSWHCTSQLLMCDVLAADEVEAVVVLVDAVVDADAVELHVAALEDADGVIGAVVEEDVADAEVLALMKEQVIGPVGAAEARRAASPAARAAELRALAVDRAGAFDGDVLGVDGEDEPDVAVAERGVAVQRDGVAGVVLLAVGAAEQLASGGDVQGDVALQFDGADDEHAGGDEHRAALVAIAGVDRGLDGRGVERVAVAFGCRNRGCCRS